jgi:hypothetical protein
MSYVQKAPKSEIAVRDDRLHVNVHLNYKVLVVLAVVVDVFHTSINELVHRLGF